MKLVRLVFFARTFFGRPLETIRLYMPNGNSSQRLANVISVRDFAFNLIFRYFLFQLVEFQLDVSYHTGAVIGIQDRLSSILIQRLFEPYCDSSPSPSVT